MSLNTLVVILLLLLSIWWLMRKRRQSKEGAAAPMLPVKKKTPFHAVSIRFEKDACAAAKAMAGRRFLATAPPKIPLPDCDVLHCKCRFTHHDDRRSGKDRRSPFAPGNTIAGTGAYNVEKRAGGDRRRKVEE